MDRRQPIKFLMNSPVEVAFQFTEGKPVDTAYGGKTMWSTTDGRVLFADQELAARINFAEPAPGGALWITKRSRWQETGHKRHRVTTWEVTSTPPPSRQPLLGVPTGQSRIAKEVTESEEIPLEQRLRESIKVRETAANRLRVKQNLERKENPPAAALEAANSSEPPKKPVTMETSSPPVPPTPAHSGAPESKERHVWFPNLVEVARSFSYKLNAGDYETRDFFCSEKAECRPEDADLVSERLYDFCKRQVLRAVEQYITEHRAKKTA
jgi:hypothetical protein